MSEMCIGKLSHLCGKDHTIFQRGALLASTCSLELGSDHTIQQDNASCHSTKYRKNWKARNEVNLPNWPAQSLCWSPMEHLWDVLGNSLGSTPFLNYVKLWRHLQELGDSFHVSQFLKTVESMTRHVEAILKHTEATHATKCISHACVLCVCVYLYWYKSFRYTFGHFFFAYVKPLMYLIIHTSN